MGPASLVLFDVSTLYFETDKADGFREPGFSKERRLDPQITIGLLTDASGFPLMVQAFEGNKAETKTMLPVLRSFMAAHQLADVTVVADAGMFSEANQAAIEAAEKAVIDAEKIATLERGEIPFFEPGLGDLVARNREAGRLSFSTDLDKGGASGFGEGSRRSSTTAAESS